MFWSLTSPAVVRVGETGGALTLVLDEIPGEAPVSLTAKWALFPWNGDAGSMGYQAASAATPVGHTEPHTGETYWSVVLTMPKNLIPSDIDPGLYYLSVRFEDDDEVEFPLPKRAIGIQVVEEFA